MSFFGRLFGTEKALTAIVDSASKGIDALVYTDEEKAGDAAKDRSEARSMVVQWMQATQGQNLARRLIALSITGVWLGMYVFSVVCQMVVVFVPEKVQELIALSTISKEAAIELNPAAMLILAFYFAAGNISDIAKAIFKKKPDANRIG